MKISKEKFDSLVNTLFYYINRVQELEVDVEILDAQMIALGNLMIKKGFVDKEEIKTYTDGVMGMKISEKRRKRNIGFLGKPFTKEDVEEMISTGSFSQIKQEGKNE